jgi:hypothetical protein
MKVKITLEITEIDDGRKASALVDCPAGFAHLETYLAKHLDPLVGELLHAPYAGRARKIRGLER